MNVTVKPLAWKTADGSRVQTADTPFGEMSVFRTVRGTWCFVLANKFAAAEVATVEAAKLAAERWYTARVLDCLEPADTATAAEFVTLYAQCNGEYDR